MVSSCFMTLGASAERLFPDIPRSSGGTIRRIIALNGPDRQINEAQQTPQAAEDFGWCRQAAPNSQAKQETERRQREVKKPVASRVDGRSEVKLSDDRQVDPHERQECAEID